MDTQNRQITVTTNHFSVYAIFEEPASEGQTPKVFLTRNPFRAGDQTTFVLRLTDTSRVRLEIRDLAGNRVRTLLAREEFPAGSHSVVWDGNDDYGRPAPSGLYAYVYVPDLDKPGVRIVKPIGVVR